MRYIVKIFTFITILCISNIAISQTLWKNSRSYRYGDSIKLRHPIVRIKPIIYNDTINHDSISSPKCKIDSAKLIDTGSMPIYFYGPAVYHDYVLEDTFTSFLLPESKGNAFKWIERENAIYERMRIARQRHIINHPEMVKYNINNLPEPPKKFRAVVDPSQSKIIIEEINVDNKNFDDIAPVEIKRKNWLHNFDASLQFSQAYISPNWYQGGNNNLNILLDLIYNIKLNQAFYPNILFETTARYKLGQNSVPDDSIRNYSISEDLFQINSKFGLKASKSWYYSVSLMFKTQLFKGYKTNSNDLKAAFLSPGELNIGLGMTYNYAHPKNKFTFDASISPLSYNLKTCINKNMDETAYGIAEGHKTVNEIGSSAECKFMYKLTHNIIYTSRLFMFSDYGYIQGDWENKVAFNVNRFLSTQIYVHLRYDSSTTRTADTSWHHWQMKEILSFGFSYNIGSI